MKRSRQRQTQVFGFAGPAHDLIGANTVRAQQDDLSPLDMLVRGDVRAAYSMDTSSGSQ
jgi:hypothetical protein